MPSGTLNNCGGQSIERKGLVFVHEMTNNKHRETLENCHLKVGDSA